MKNFVSELSFKLKYAFFFTDPLIPLFITISYEIENAHLVSAPCTFRAEYVWLIGFYSCTYRRVHLTSLASSSVQTPLT